MKTIYGHGMTVNTLGKLSNLALHKRLRYFSLTGEILKRYWEVFRRLMIEVKNNRGWENMRIITGVIFKKFSEEYNQEAVSRG
ncbi:hypothetical protein [Bacillus dakarensis]|uniref:hypothetical protein n=1 Tax=Robertmurraya dakarensis TaxID=1926278 RepID=UPI000981382A|nr:hypothetical protein [Bacillus dakarensis]